MESTKLDEHNEPKQITKTKLHELKRKNEQSYKEAVEISAIYISLQLNMIRQSLKTIFMWHLMQRNSSM